MTLMSFKPWRWRLVLAGLLGLVVLTLALWLADLMGVSKSWINGFFLVVSIIGYAVIGMFCRTTNPEEYFVAGRSISARMNGMATAADWLSAASFIGLTRLLLSDGFVGDGQARHLAAGRNAKPQVALPVFVEHGRQRNQALLEFGKAGFEFDGFGFGLRPLARIGRTARAGSHRTSRSGWRCAGKASAQ